MRKLLVSSIIFLCISIISCITGSEPQLYDLRVSPNPAGAGTISPADTAMEEGTPINLKAQANEGYLFTHWSGDVDSTSANPLSLTIDKAYSLEAHFDKKSYELTVTTEGKGTVSERVLQKRSKEYPHGTVVELSAEAEDGWKFVEWKGAETSNLNPLQVTIRNTSEITAVFAEAFYLAENGITIKCPAADVGESGMVNGATYTKRTRAQITVSNAATTCTSGIEDMSDLFNGSSGFNEDISHWDVSSVTNMEGMFSFTYHFNQDIGAWDISNVTDMGMMFYRDYDFNQDISSWDVSKVTNMRAMFQDVTSFNQDIGDWDVSSVTQMNGMFKNVEVFNQDIGGWQVGNVTDMSGMFYNAVSFNQDIGNWDVSNVSTMISLFRGANAFNQDIGKWEVDNVTNMSFMFRNATSFNQDIGDWNVSNVTYMTSMFSGAEAFNQDIGEWDVRNVADMEFMFSDAATFNQDLSSWCVPNFNTEPSFFATGSALIDSYMPQWGTCPE